MPPDIPTLTIARLVRVLDNHSADDMSLPQYRVLGLLSLGDERSSQLASRLAMTKPTLTAIVDSLVEQGYVTREASDGDRRVVRLSITALGNAAVGTTGAALREVLDDVVDRCAHPAAVLAALEELRQALDDRWADRLATRATRDQAKGTKSE